MLKVWMVVFLIFGTFFGSGFSSGNEIVVFFSRFGVLSYLYILIAGILLFFVFWFFLRLGKIVMKKIENSKILNFITFFVSLVFAASMFAGVKSLFGYFPTWLSDLLLAVVLFATFLSVRKGVAGLEKVNFFLMPFTGIVFLIVLVYGSRISSDVTISVSSWAGFLYSPLYVTLNTAMGGTLIASAGEGMTKKQTFFASLFSSVLLVFFLLFGNYVLQNNTESFVAEMPFLSIVKQNKLMFWLEFFVILVGCFTTLLSLCFTLKSCFLKVVSNQGTSSFLSVFVPFLLSGVGFSQIVSNLYPICSVFGVFVLLFAIASLKQTDKKIHSKCKDAKNGGCRHH